MPPDDFFNEDWEEPSRTQETAVTRPAGEPAEPARRRSPGGRGPRRPRHGGGPARPEWGRLGLLGAGVLVVLALVYLVATSFFGSSGNATAAYFAKLQPALSLSDRAGAELRTILDSRPMTAAAFQQRLKTPIADAQRAYQSAQGVHPSSAVSAYAPFMIEALRYRWVALTCMSENATAAFRQRGVTVAGAKLTSCTQLMMASDQLYLNSFYTQAVDARTGTAVPTSRFLPPGDTRLVTPLGIGQVIARLRPSAARGLHGMQLVSVVANPGRNHLSPTGINKVTSNAQLRFVVTVSDGGSYEEVLVPVTLTLTVAGQKPITVTRTIASVAPGLRATVVFANPFSASSQPQYVRPYTLTVRIHGVLGEHNLSNNAASYRVSFVVG